MPSIRSLLKRGGRGRRIRAYKRGGRRNLLGRSRYGSRAVRNPRVTSVVTIGKEMPDRCRVILKYTDLYSFTAAPNPSAQVWKINSLFDPDLTGTGHQPQGFDQWSAFYNTYQVYGAKVDLEIANDTASASVQCVMAMSDTNSSAYNVLDTTELKWTKYKIVGPASATNKTRMSMYMSIKKIHGFNDISEVESTSANITGDPTDLAFCWFKCQSMDILTNVKLFVRATITFYAVFSEQKNPAES